MKKLFLAAAIALVAAAPASAGQILYADQDNLYAINEDGSGKRTLINADGFGTEAVYDPWVQPNGQFVVFQARTPASGHGGLYCGFNCVTLFGWQAGTDTALQLTGNPTGCGGDLCAGLNVDGRTTADLKTLYYEQIYAEPNSSGTFNSIRTPYKGAVKDGGDPQAQEVKHANQKVEGVTPSPDDPNVVAWDMYNPDYDYEDTTPRYVLFLGTPGGSAVAIGGDDQDISGLAWRADGNALLTVEGGTDPGIWLYTLDGQTQPRRVANLPWDYDRGQFSTQPAFVGNDKITFGYGKDLYTIAASCTDCSIGQATKIAGPIESLSGPAATTEDIPLPPDPTPTPTPGGTTGGTGTTSGTNTGTGGTPGAVLAAAITPKALKDNVFAKKGAAVPFTASAPGTLTLKATVTAAQARSLGISRSARKPVTVASGTTALTKAGAGTLTLKPTKAAARRLKALRRNLTLSLAGTYTAGTQSKAVTGRLTIRR